MIYPHKIHVCYIMVNGSKYTGSYGVYIKESLKFVLDDDKPRKQAKKQGDRIDF